MQSAGFHAKGLVRSREKHLSCLDYSQSTGLLWRLVKRPPCHTASHTLTTVSRLGYSGGWSSRRLATLAQIQILRLFANRHTVGWLASDLPYLLQHHLGRS